MDALRSVASCRGLMLTTIWLGYVLAHTSKLVGMGQGYYGCHGGDDGDFDHPARLWQHSFPQNRGNNCGYRYFVVIFCAKQAYIPTFMTDGPTRKATPVEATNSAKSLAKPIKSVTWQVFDIQRLQDHVDAGRSVFVDVTASWCVTCQFNKKTVIESHAVQQWLRDDDDVIAMRADWTQPTQKLPPIWPHLGAMVSHLMFYMAPMQKMVSY